MGVPFEQRGRRLDEQLEIMQLVWRETPASYRGEFYSFENISVVPKPVQKGGIEIIIGGDRLSKAVIRRIVRYGRGYTLTSAPDPEGLARLREAMEEAGRSLSELRTGGLVLPIFPDPKKKADLARSVSECVPPLIEAGVDSLTVKPSQFIDRPSEMPAFLKELDDRVEALV
jgi:alkanesulfonate monooxygenase SsuD/methylene tetrahydromethanopterin reductase-like flavin-dependent oxidoreductase (luciferase family)